VRFGPGERSRATDVLVCLDKFRLRTERVIVSWVEGWVGWAEAEVEEREGEYVGGEAGPRGWGIDVEGIAEGRQTHEVKWALKLLDVKVVKEEPGMMEGPDWELKVSEAEVREVEAWEAEAEEDSGEGVEW
jgi:hypothetical protein